MKTKAKFVVTSILILLGIYFIFTWKSNNEFRSIRIAILKGENVFNKNCSSCHGINSSFKISDINVDLIFDRNYSYSQQDALHKQLVNDLDHESKTALKLYIEFEKKNSVKP